MPRKKHWTQTPQGRKRLSQIAASRQFNQKAAKVAETSAQPVQTAIVEHPFERGYRNGVRFAFSSILRRIADALQDC